MRILLERQHLTISADVRAAVVILDQDKAIGDFLNLTQVQRLVKRLDRSLSGPLNHFSEQFMYGHREILVAYSGLPYNTVITGSMEHGWVPWGPSIGVPRWVRGRYLHLAWSSANMRRQEKNYPPNVVAVGAPFLYLRRLSEGLSVGRNSRNLKKTLFLPKHGGEAFPTKIDHQIETFAKKFNPEESTVLLYWTEFLNSRIRRNYEEAGFRVSCAGFGGHSSTEGLGILKRERSISTIGGRHLFLFNLMSELDSHQESVHGFFGSSTLYAGLMGKPTYLLLDWDQNPLSEISQFQSNLIDDSELRIVAYVKEQVLDKYFNSELEARSEFTSYCEQELGIQDMRSSEELKILLSGRSFVAGTDIPVAELVDSIRGTALFM